MLGSEIDKGRGFSRWSVSTGLYCSVSPQGCLGLLHLVLESGRLWSVQEILLWRVDTWGFRVRWLRRLRLFVRCKPSLRSRVLVSFLSRLVPNLARGRSFGTRSVDLEVGTIPRSGCFLRRLVTLVRKVSTHLDASCHISLTILRFMPQQWEGERRVQTIAYINGLSQYKQDF